MLDRYWHGDTSRISPEAPVPVVRVGEAEERAGGSGNVALNIAALGAHATVIGLTGQDEASDALRKLLSKQGVECDFEQVPESATITKLRVLSRPHNPASRGIYPAGHAPDRNTGFAVSR